jgi:hypothetical protein
MNTKNSNGIVTKPYLEREMKILGDAVIRALYKKLPEFFEKKYEMTPRGIGAAGTTTASNSTRGTIGERQIENPDRVRDLTEMAKDPEFAIGLRQRGFRSEPNPDGSRRWYRGPPAQGEMIYRTMGPTPSSKARKAVGWVRENNETVAAQRERVKQIIFDLKMQGARLSRPRS